MNRVLVTGAAGFVGHHAVEHILKATDWGVVGMVSFRHRGCPLRLTHLAEHPRMALVRHDLDAPISDRMAEHIGPVDYVLNLASESSVEHSIADPVACVENNVRVALHMLEYARVAKPRLFVQVSTDEVYGPARLAYAHHEWDPIKPSNPYSASKAAQEALAFAYWRTWSVPVVITNTMNIVGERQGREKLVPTVIRSVCQGDTVPIYSANGVAGSRYWLHARNQADALVFLCAVLDGRAPMYPQCDEPARYHVVGERELSNLEMAQAIAAIIGKPLKHELVETYASRPGHDLRYALDGSKLAALGWTPPMPLMESLERTVRWTLRHPEWLA
jgi:dTDP-glucose 4,6-dehydratase